MKVSFDSRESKINKDQSWAFKRKHLSSKSFEKNPRNIRFDLMRIAFVLSVFLYHYSAFETSKYYFFEYRSVGPLQELLSQIFVYGFLAVPGFFALSGYFIDRLSTQKDPIEFISSRVRRILPSLLLVSFGLFVYEAARGLNPPISSLFFLSQTRGAPLLDTAFWSLWVELKFYFLYFLYLLFRRQFNSKFVDVVFVSAVSMLLIFNPLLPEVVQQLFIADYLPLFMFGIYVNRIQNRKFAQFDILPLSYLLYFCVESNWKAGLFHNELAIQSVTYTGVTLTSVITFITILLLALYPRKREKAGVFSRVVSFLGPRTYEFYLVHLASASIFGNLLVESGLVNESLYLLPMILMFTIIYALIVHRISHSQFVTNFMNWDFKA